MAFALKAHQIRCTNCDYEGKAEIKGSGGAGVVLGILLVIGGLFFPGLGAAGLVIAAIGVIVGLASMFGEAKQICPKCKWEHPKRLD